MLGELLFFFLAVLYGTAFLSSLQSFINFRLGSAFTYWILLIYRIPYISDLYKLSCNNCQYLIQLFLKETGFAFTKMAVLFHNHVVNFSDKCDDLFSQVNVYNQGFPVDVQAYSDTLLIFCVRGAYLGNDKLWLFLNKHQPASCTQEYHINSLLNDKFRMDQYWQPPLCSPIQKVEWLIFHQTENNDFSNYTLTPCSSLATNIVIGSAGPTQEKPWLKQDLVTWFPTIFKYENNNNNIDENEDNNKLRKRMTGPERRRRTQILLLINEIKSQQNKEFLIITRTNQTVEVLH